MPRLVPSGGAAPSGHAQVVFEIAALLIRGFRWAPRVAVRALFYHGVERAVLSREGIKKSPALRIKSTHAEARRPAHGVQHVGRFRGSQVVPPRGKGVKQRRVLGVASAVVFEVIAELVVVREVRATQRASNHGVDDVVRGCHGELVRRGLFLFVTP